jgi:hypothetical protein
VAGLVRVEVRPLVVRDALDLVLSIETGLDNDLAGMEGADVHQFELDPVRRDAPDEGRDIGGQAGPAPVRVKVAEMRLNESGIIDLLGRAAGELEESFR